MSTITGAALLQRISDAKNEVDSIIQQLHSFSGTTAAFKHLDISARQNMLKLKSEIKTAEQKLALGEVEQSLFTDAFQDKLETLKTLSARLGTDLTNARRVAGKATGVADRTHLFESSTDVPQPKQTSRKVTESLQFSKLVLKSNVESGIEALGILKSDKDRITNVNAKMDDITANLNEGDNLLTKFKRKDCIDKLWIGAALFVYIVTVLWIIDRRLGVHNMVLMLMDFFEPLVLALLSSLESTVALVLNATTSVTSTSSSPSSLTPSLSVLPSPTQSPINFESG
eukprot:m.158026 g.158026  ORF g.158026 m.158026 type:complete len:285 (-) comp31073_c0_seq2:45-899(-)